MRSILRVLALGAFLGMSGRPAVQADGAAVAGGDASGQAGADGTGFRPDVEGASMDGRDASRHETGLQLFGELVVPAELA